VTVVSRSLDDLDRLAFRLSRVVRTQYPQLLHQGFTLTDLEERLLPYREVRREMADSGPDAFEAAVLRLIAGERDYLETDAALQTAARNALSFPSPTLAMIRSWSSTTLSLVSGGGTPPGGMPSAGTTLTGALSAGAASPGNDTPIVGDVFPSPTRVTNPAPTRSAEQRASSPESQSGLPSALGGRAGVLSRMTTPRRAQAAIGRASALPVACCRYCDSRLPEARRVTFCPHCGMDLTKKQCAACSTELEVDWKYCVTCGRPGD